LTDAAPSLRTRLPGGPVPASRSTLPRFSHRRAACSRSAFPPWLHSTPDRPSPAIPPRLRPCPASHRAR